MTSKRFAKIARDGLLDQNPTFRLVLGTCPTLALTASASTALGMGLSVTFVLICSNVIISLLRKLIPSQVRIPAYILIIATFVTILRMAVEKYIPTLYDAMGTFLPLIVVNCIILGRAEAFARKNPVADSAADGLFMGLGFTLALTFMGIFREILGSGTIFESVVLFENFSIGFFATTSGAFFTFGMFIALFSLIYSKVTESIKRRRILNPSKALNASEVER